LTSTILTSNPTSKVASDLALALEHERALFKTGATGNEHGDGIIKMMRVLRGEQSEESDPVASGVEEG
jgi:hypothetical protein